MKTLYRKVAVSERLPEKDGEYFCIIRSGKCGNYDLFNNKFDSLLITHWLEEVPDPTTQLQADKAELLEALEKLRNHYGLFPENRIEIESLIQKMKKCQENTPH